MRTGVERIAEAFAAAHANGRRAALMPYMMGGFPDLERSYEIGRAYADGGADLIELGVPFSDPLADGPVIHAAATVALGAGARLPNVLELGREVAQSVPVVVMCYANVILAHGVERFADALVDADVSGVIVPDLPFEEATTMRTACHERGLALVPLVAPTTPPARLALIGESARGFLYAVALTGTTGERDALDQAVGPLVARAAEHTAVPVAVGFGIATPALAVAAASAGADGVIVGSRLVRAAGESRDPAGEVRELLEQFSTALLEPSLS